MVLEGDIENIVANPCSPIVLWQRQPFVVGGGAKLVKDVWSNSEKGVTEVLQV
jgi:hypothetical protein